MRWLLPSFVCDTIHTNPNTNMSFKSKYLCFCALITLTIGDINDYIFVEDEVNWIEANLICWNRFNSTLATISSTQQNEIASSLCSNDSCWIGISNIFTSTLYTFDNIGQQEYYTQISVKQQLQIIPHHHFNVLQYHHPEICHVGVAMNAKVPNTQFYVTILIINR